VQLLGPAKVIDHPYHWKHRWDLTFTGDPEKDWGRERGMLGFTPENKRVSMYSEEELRDELSRGNIKRIFLDERDETYALYMKLRANFYDVPVVVVAGHDRFWNRSPEFVAARYGTRLEAMFLDNWRPEYDSIPKAHVYNWCINFDQYWTPHRTQEKKYDISFQGYNSHPDRARIIDHVLSKWGHLRLKIDLEREPNTMRAYVRKNVYFDVMAQSRICLNLRGAAENGKTLRFYEIPYVGSLMLTQDSGAVQIEPFLDRRHCLYFKDLKRLDEQIEFALESEKRAQWIAWQGHSHAMAHHTLRARMLQMYAVLK
jgi:glutaredoxin